MLDIKIDISDLLMEFSSIANKSEDLKTAILQDVKDKFQFIWENKVNSTLNQTRKEYLQASSYEIVQNQLIISLNPTSSNLPLKIEDGAEPWDMQEGFRNSSKKKMKADGGWYLTIPFKWATSEAVATSQSFSNKMPKSGIIEKEVKRQGTLNYVSKLPEQYQKIMSNSVTKMPHTAPIVQGMKKYDQSSTGNEKRGGYMTFRRVSDKTLDDKWIHPGFTAKKLMDQTMSEIEPKISDIIDRSIDEFLFQNI